MKYWKCLSPQHSSSQTMCQSSVPLYLLQDMNTERCSNRHCKILPGQKLKKGSSLGNTPNLHNQYERSINDNTEKVKSTDLQERNLEQHFKCPRRIYMTWRQEIDDHGTSLTCVVHHLKIIKIEWGMGSVCSRHTFHNFYIMTYIKKI